MKDWPYSTHPTGWYQVDWSAELKAGDVKNLEIFDEEVVLYRTESGQVALVDAYCPHLGGHFGHGGCVVGENIQCPWHGWQWDMEGRNAEIPFTDQVHRRHPTIRVKQWPVREVDGIVVTWYDGEGREPFWEWPGIPEFRDPEHYYQPIPHGYLRVEPRGVKPQSVTENAADSQHFPWVHGSGEPADILEWETKQHYLRSVMALRFGVGSDETWLTPNGEETAYIESEFWGLGLGVARFRLEGLVTAQLVATTPMNHEKSHLFSSVASTIEPGHPDTPGGRSGRMMEVQHGQIQRDFSIWENQRYIRKPLSLTEVEKYITPLRRWADQFYTDKFYRDAEDANGNGNGNGNASGNGTGSPTAAGATEEVR